jgi:F-type H+-transporting ATPase subunit c
MIEFALTLSGGNPRMEGNITEGLKLLGAGMAAIGMLGPGIGIGLVAAGAVQAMGRNPEFTPTIQTNMILGIVFAESVAIYALVVALILLFVA